MESGRFIIEEWIVIYFEPHRTEGGPELQLRFSVRETAERKVDQLRRNKDVSWVQLWKQVSQITRARIS